MSVKYISQLKPPGQNQIVKIRVTRIWDCYVPTSNRFLGIAFLATDSQGDAIHVQIRDFDCPKFQEKLIEGSIYKIAKFQVVRPNIRYLSTTREFAILFSSITQLVLIHDDPTPYPRYHFEFLDREKMAPQANSDKYLIDAIGTLISIGPIMNVQLTKYDKIVEKRDVILKETSGDELKITVWESTLPQLNANKLLQIRPNPVLLFVGTIIKTFQGIIYLASTSATKIYINLDIPETKAIQQQQKLGEQPVQLLALSSQIPNMQQRIQEAKYATISQLLQFSPATIGNALFTCDAWVEEIDTSNGWFFYSCNICKKVMIETENGELACYDHGQGIPKLTLRLRMIIKDETADMEITAFDKQAELMTNLNVEFLQTIEEISQSIVPEKITAIVKKKFSFTIGLPPKAVKDDILTYRIYRTKGIQLEGQRSTQTQKVQLAFSQSSMEDKSENSETKPQNDTNDALESFIQVGLPQDLALEESPAKKQRRGKEKIE